MPETYCRCNGNGRCKACSCQKMGKRCLNCLPARKGTCCNLSIQVASLPQSAEESSSHLPTRLYTTSPMLLPLPPSALRLSAVVSTTSSMQSPVPLVSQASTISTAIPVPVVIGNEHGTATQASPQHVHINDDAPHDILASRTMPPPRNLPPSTQMSPPNFFWSESMNGEDFIQVVSAAYEEIIHWRRSLFLTPSGKAGKLFVSEMARLFGAYGEGSALKSIALKAAMIMPALLLQKPYASSKAREYAACLQCRLISWKEGDIDILIREGRTIQKHLRKVTGCRNDDQRITCIFTKLMFEGKVRAAMRVLSVEGKGASLPLDSVLTTGDHQSNVTVREELIRKHPPGQPAHSNNVLDACNSDVHPVLYECIDRAAIRKAAIRTNGSVGPSGLDACGWKRLYTSFQNPSADLCNSLAMVARRICTLYVDPEGLAPFTACRLIALDKCPGIRPIGVGETSRRIIGKAILSALMPYIQESVGSLQLCAGQQAG